MKRFEELTNQEHRVLVLVTQGWRNTSIARELFISPCTRLRHGRPSVENVPHLVHDRL